MSSIVLSELLFGAALSTRPDVGRQDVALLTQMIPVIDFDALAARHAGDIRADLRRRGVPIGHNDGLIAAHARSRGLIVVTGNLREFQRVDGLRVEDWPAGVEP